MDGGLLEASIGIGGQFSRWLKPTDFLPGSVVTFEMASSGSKLFSVEILGHDEYTRKLLEDKASSKMERFIKAFSAEGCFMCDAQPRLIMFWWSTYIHTLLHGTCLKEG